MKYIKRTLASLLILSTLVSGAESPKDIEETKRCEEAFAYGSIGLGPMPIPLPLFGIGYRNQIDKNASDFSLQILPLGRAMVTQINLLYLHYPHPNPASQFYLGWGGAVGGYFPFYRDHDGSYPYFAPEFVFGKQYITKTDSRRFLQLQIEWPIFDFRRDSTYFYPAVIFSYGIGF